MKKLVICLMAFAVCLESSASTGTRGGGNSVGDQIIEGYAVSVESIPSYKAVTKPILDKLKKNFPNLGTQLDDSLSRLTWYVLPAQLKPVDGNETGLPLVSSQVASQDLINDEVFIDEIEFAKLNERNKGALILHEIFIDLTCNTKCNPSDYTNIRKLVTALMTSDSSEKLQDALYNVFMFHSHFPSDTYQLVFTAEQDTHYQVIFGQYKEALHQSCQGVPFSNDIERSLGDVLTSADQKFRSSETCKQEAFVCNGLPPMDGRLYLGGYAELYKVFNCSDKK